MLLRVESTSTLGTQARNAYLYTPHKFHNEYLLSKESELAAARCRLFCNSIYGGIRFCCMIPFFIEYTCTGNIINRKLTATKIINQKRPAINKTIVDEEIKNPQILLYTNTVARQRFVQGPRNSLETLAM